jgi:hypothetical protein
MAACERRGEPVPLICTEAKISVNDQVTIRQSDTLVLVNCSKRFSKQRWELPNGGTSTSETVYYIPESTGTFEIRLFVSNDDFVNEYEAVKYVVVNP